MCAVGHHVEDEDASARLQGAIGAGENVADLLRRLLVECAEDRDGVVGLGLVFVRMVVARTALDAIRKPGLGDAVACDGAHGGHVDCHHGNFGIRLGDQLGIGSGSTREIQQLRAAREVEHRHHATTDRQRAATHGEGEAACPLGIVAQVQLRGLDRLARAGEVREASPGRIDVLVVADRLREIGGAARHKCHLARLGVEVGVFLLAEQTLRDTGVQKQAQPARRSARLMRERREVARPTKVGKSLEDPDIKRGEKHGTAVEGTCKVDDFGNGFVSHGKFQVQG